MAEANGKTRRSPKTIGVASEALVMSRLVELGYHVSLPFGDHLRYDLIVDDGESLSRIQVKTGRLRGGSVVFSAHSTNWYTHEQRGYQGEADDFLVYCPDTNEIYRVAVEDCGQSSNVSLRVNEQSQRTGRPALRWAKDHVLDQSARTRRLGPLKACGTVHPDTPSRIAEVSGSEGVPRRRYCKECNLVWCRQSRARQRAAASA